MKAKFIYLNFMTAHNYVLFSGLFIQSVYHFTDLVTQSFKFLAQANDKTRVLKRLNENRLA